MQPQQGTPRRAASQPPVGAHPGLADLMHAAQRQPIPEVLAKFDDAYRDVGTTLRIFQERRRSSLAEQGPFTNIVAKLENDTPDDIFADTATTAAANGTAPPQPPIGSQNGGGAWDGSGMTVQSMPPSTSSGRPAAVAPIPSSTQPGSLNASQGVLTPARRSSISILAAANLVSQMAQVTAQASGTSTSEVMQAARRSSVSVQSDSAVRSRAAATGSSVRGSFAAGLNGDLRRSHSQGKDPRPANVTPAGHGSSPLVGGAQQQHTLFTSSGSGPSALISGAFMSAMSGNSDPIGTTTGNAAAHESMPIVPGALQPAFLDLELQSSPYQVPLTGPGSSMPVIAPPAMDPSGGSGGAVTSTYSLSHRPPAHLPPVIRAAPSVSSPFSPMGDAPYSPPPLPHVTPPMPVFQMAIIGGDGEVAKPAKPEMEFIPVTPKMDLGGVGGVGIDMPRSRSRTRSIGDNAMATIAADFLNGAHGGGTKVFPFYSVKMRPQSH
ncbi:hypothetical protein BC828DRAFT_67691 [Blastocladiella britannica]|nr:hypothetical protein BC828DRAFT_67691 [Blastocladiella britannica]